MPRFTYLTVASSLHDPTAVDHLTGDVRATLHAAGGEAATAPEVEVQVPLVVLVATGGTEAGILEAARRRIEVVSFEPLLLVAHPLHNSLPASLEALARWRRDGGRGRIIQVSGGPTSALVEAVSDVAALHRLHQTVLGQVGAPSDWLVASVPDREAVRSRWGVEVRDVDIGATIARHARVEEADVRAVAVRFSGGREPTSDLMRAAALRPALVEGMAETGVDAITVRCFDYLGALQTSGCVALADLNDDGVVAGCEGDVASAVAMLVVRALFAQASWIANPASIDDTGGRVLLAHCTVARSLVEEVSLHTHFESGLGIGLRGTFRPGPVTLLRLGGRALERWWVAEGEIGEQPTSPDLCRTQVWVQVDRGEVGELLSDPLGNHLVMFHGRHRDRLLRWWQLAFG